MERQDILKMFEIIKTDDEIQKQFLSLLVNNLDLRENPYHPLVFISGTPKIGKNVYIGLLSEINSNKSLVEIGDNCDIASFVSINAADSHKFSIGIAKEIERSNIILENNVFVGSHSFIGGNTHIGHHSVVGAGTILINGGKIPPYSLIVGNPFKILAGHFKNK